MDRVSLIIVSNMVLNTITNNMEKLIMKSKAIFHNDTNIKNALLLFGQGWTASRIAKKMKVSDQTIYNWKRKFPKYAVRKVTSTIISKTGSNNTTTTIKPVEVKSTRTHEVTITLEKTPHELLIKLATHEVRTIADQVKYLVLRELQRLERNNTNIPF